MKGVATDELGMFEGFNFREQSAIDHLLTAEEILSWEHDEQGEAEFWPHGDNFFVAKLLPGTAFTAHELRQVIRIFEELDGNENKLARAVYLLDRGESLENITREAIDDACLYVFGPGYFIDLEKEAAYELFETFWPEAYQQWEQNAVPGLRFDIESFLEHFSTLELKRSDGGGYLIVDTQ